MVGTWQHAGRHGAGGAESSTSQSEGHQEKIHILMQLERSFLVQWVETSKAHSHSNTPSPRRPHPEILCHSLAKHIQIITHPHPDLYMEGQLTGHPMVRFRMMFMEQGEGTRVLMFPFAQSTPGQSTRQHSSAKLT